MSYPGSVNLILVSPEQGIFQLNSGIRFWVSQEDIIHVVKHKWYFSGRVLRHGPRRIHVCLHVEIAQRMGLDCSNDIDHKDTNYFNNYRDNLRPATRSQNSANRGCQSNNKLGVKGVSLVDGQYQAKIQRNGVQKHLGYFSTVEEAASAYEIAAAQLFGEFARIT